MSANSDAVNERLATERSAATDAGPAQGAPESVMGQDGPESGMVQDRPESEMVQDGPESGMVQDRPESGMVQDRPEPEVIQERPGEDGRYGLVNASPAPDGEDTSLAAAREASDVLLGEEELQRTVTRWKEIQADFVDDPRSAVQQADALVADLVQRLVAMFARERAGLEREWAAGDGVSTEELRQSMRRYRTFFERLLAA